MILINFKGIKFYTTAVKELDEVAKAEMKQGKIIEGKIRELVHHYDEYWIPIDKIKEVSIKSGHYYVNDIEVNEMEFTAVIGMMENLDNAAIFNCFSKRDFKIVNQKIQLNIQGDNDNEIK